MNIVAFDHLNMTVNNLDQTLDWYQRVFGFKPVEGGISEDGVRWRIIRKNDSMLCIYEHEKRNPANLGNDQFQRINHFGVRIDNVELWEKTIQDQNLETYYGSPVRYPHSTSWYVQDPSGYTIEVTKWNEEKVDFDTAKSHPMFGIKSRS